MWKRLAISPLLPPGVVTITPQEQHRTSLPDAIALCLKLTNVFLCVYPALERARSDFKELKTEYESQHIMKELCLPWSH